MAFNSLLVLLIILVALLVLARYQYIAGILDQLTSSVKTQVDAFLAPRDQVVPNKDPAATTPGQVVDIPAPLNQESAVSNAPSPIPENNPVAADSIRAEQSPPETVPQQEQAMKEAATAPAATPPPSEDVLTEPPQKTVMAKKGDVVSALALKEYGVLNDTIFDVIKRTNPDIDNLDRIIIGQKINLPQFDHENLMVLEEKSIFSIHVATFSSYNDAEEFVAAVLEKKDLPSITPVNVVGNQPWYRVTVGNFDNRSDASEFAKKFKSYNLPDTILTE